MIRLLFLASAFLSRCRFLTGIIVLLLIRGPRHSRVVLARRTVRTSLGLLIEIGRLVLLHIVLALARVLRSIVLVRGSHVAVADEHGACWASLVPL